MYAELGRCFRRLCCISRSIGGAVLDAPGTESQEEITSVVEGQNRSGNFFEQVIFHKELKYRIGSVVASSVELDGDSREREYIS